MISDRLSSPYPHSIPTTFVFVAYSLRVCYLVGAGSKTQSKHYQSCIGVKKMTNKIRFSLFENRYSRQPTVAEVDLETFFEGMKKPVNLAAEDKNNLPLWSPTIFDGNRSQSNAEELTCLVYDVDDGDTPFSTWQLFCDYWVIAHTSFSHKPQHHKYRIILPLAKPIPAKDWDLAHIAGLELWGKVVGRGEPDIKALKDRARMYYRFALPKTDKAASHPLHPHNYHNVDGWDGGHPLHLDYSHIKRPEKPKARPLVKGQTYKKSELMMSPQARLEVARRCDATISGNVARKIICPQCNRASVHFYIDLTGEPNPQKTAACNHRGSCGWWGFLETLL